MKVYIAAPWKDKLLAQAFASRCEDRGLEITHKWWLDEAQDDEHEKLRGYALKDVSGVKRADVLILLDTQKSEGKATEQGMAIAWGKPIIAVGTRGSESLNVFHHLPQYQWVATPDDVWEALLGLTH